MRPSQWQQQQHMNNNNSLSGGLPSSYQWNHPHRHHSQDHFEDDAAIVAQRKSLIKKKMAQVVLQNSASVTLERDATELLKEHEHYHTYFKYDSNVTSTECLVCLAPYCKGDTVISLSCGHSYHSQCLQEWLERQCHCPYCRLDLEKEYRERDQCRRKGSTRSSGSGEGGSNDGGSSIGYGGSGSPLDFNSHWSSWVQAKVLSEIDNNSNNSSQCNRFSHQHPHHQHRRKPVLAHVLEEQQETLKHQWHQRTVIQQLSFSPVLCTPIPVGVDVDPVVA